jgi:hypothetical protein
VDRLWVRVTAALVFLAAWAAPVVLEATDTQGISTQPPWEVISLIGWYGGVSVAAGFLTRFPALLLPIVLFVAVIPLDDENSEIGYQGIIAIYSVILAYPGILLGILTRIAYERLRAHPQPESAS